jgi:hypothetical protein
MTYHSNIAHSLITRTYKINETNSFQNKVLKDNNFSIFHTPRDVFAYPRLKTADVEHDRYVSLLVSTLHADRLRGLRVLVHPPQLNSFPSYGHSASGSEATA